MCHGAGHVQRRISGVTIGGVHWRLGSHCLYLDTADSATRYGTVTNMFHGVDAMMDEFVIFELEQTPITSYRGHYCLLSADGHTSVFVMWDRIKWKCKRLNFGGHTDMALPIQSCTSEELIQLR
jgi:hypothetical protein